MTCREELDLTASLLCFSLCKVRSTSIQCVHEVTVQLSYLRDENYFKKNLYSTKPAELFICSHITRLSVKVSSGLASVFRREASVSGYTPYIKFVSKITSRLQYMVTIYRITAICSVVRNLREHRYSLYSALNDRSMVVNKG